MADNAVQVPTVAPTPTSTVQSSKPVTLIQRIDADEGLKAKRKLLTVVSLILLAIAFSGAKVVEANTFIMKITFTNQNGISYLLLLSIAFLMIRYYNYARPYHDELYNAWTKRMCEKTLYVNHAVDDHYIPGLMTHLSPDELCYESCKRSSYGFWHYSYAYKWLILREIKFFWSNDGESHNQEVVSLLSKTSPWDYFKLLVLESKYQMTSFFTHRENLDILSPYLLGCFSILSFIFNKEIIEILKGLTS
jgi:hypothetical protein